MFPFLQLPVELQKRVVLPFLNARDIVALKTTCRTLKERFPISQLITTLPARILEGSHDEGDCYYPVLKLLPFTGQGRVVVSRKLTFQWRDQGWGNRKGRVALVTCINDTMPQPNRNPATMGRVLCHTMEDAEHHNTTETFDVSAVMTTTSDEREESYYLLLKAGGGGGHSLTVHHIQLQTVILDYPDHSLSKLYPILSNLGVLSGGGDAGRSLQTNTQYYNYNSPPFLLQTLKAAARDLLHALEAIETQPQQHQTILTLFQENGIPMTTTSVAAIVELLEVWPVGRECILIAQDDDMDGMGGDY